MPIPKMYNMSLEVAPRVKPMILLVCKLSTTVKVSDYDYLNGDRLSA